MLKSDAFADGIEDLHGHMTDLKRQVETEPAAHRVLLDIAFETMNNTIEELRVAEEEMHQQNEALADAQEVVATWRHYYEDLFESAPGAYLVTDLGGTVREANRVASQCLGLSSRFLKGKPFALFVSEEGRAAFRRLLTDVGRENEATEREARLQPRRGRAFDAALTISTVRDAQGQPTGLRWLVRDLTGQTQAESERYRLLAESISDYAVILMDREGRVLNWNTGAERILGYTESEMRGNDIECTFAPEGREQGVPAQELVNAEMANHAEDARWLLRKDGSRFWAICTLTALRDKGGSLRWYAKVIRDDTARKIEEERLAQVHTRERHISATFQRALLPPLAEEAFPGLRVASLYEAAWVEAQGGGDFYDAVSLDGDRVALVVGDVSSKGLAAAAHTAEIKYTLRAFLYENPNPGRALSRLNTFIHNNHRLGAGGGEDSAFVTLAVVVVSPITGHLTAAVAGAEPPLILSAEGVAGPVAVRGSLLGMAREVEYSSVAATLAPGDMILMVTDGITEARHGNEFLDYNGMTGLAQEVPAGAGPHETGRAILEGARAFAGGSLADDACLLLARRV